MTTLQNRRTVFTLSNTEVMSNSAPTTEAGITKSEGHDGFFIYSDKAFTLWFKDQGGSWNSFNTYELADLTDGVAFSWNNNTAAFIQTNEVSHSIAVFIIETKSVGQYKNLENKNLSEAGFGRLDFHSNYKRVRMQNSGHTGEAYAIAIFDENGEASYVSAPPSGQREGKALGWDENGNLGWITLAAAVSLPEPDLYLDGSSVTPQIGNPSDVINLGSTALVTNNGKYDLKSFSFGTSGNKAPIRLNNLDLSSGIYSVSLWFYNKRSGSDYGSILRQGSTGSNSAYYPALTLNTTNELGLHLGGSSASDPNYGFRGTGYDMTSFEGLQEWSHLVVVADGTNTTFYINGQQAGNVVPHVVATHLREVGAYDGNDTQVFAEAIDEFAYWSSALSAEQVAEIYNSSVSLQDLLSSNSTPQELEEDASATFYGNATLTNGILELDGNGDYVELSNSTDYDREDGDLTVSFWFKPDTLPSSNNNFRIISKLYPWNGWMITLSTQNDDDANAMTNGGIAVYQSSTGSGSDRNNRKAPTGGISLNTWHHVAVVFTSSGDNEIYYDGSLLHSFTPVSRATTTTSPLRLGTGIIDPNSTLGKFFDGKLDKVTIQKTAATSQEIAAVYNAGAPE